jgi:hypothetical protein
VCYSSRMTTTKTVRIKVKNCTYHNDDDGGKWKVNALESSAQRSYTFAYGTAVSKISGGGSGPTNRYDGKYVELTIQGRLVTDIVILPDRAGFNVSVRVTGTRGGYHTTLTDTPTFILPNISDAALAEKAAREMYSRLLQDGDEIHVAVSPLY